MRWLHARRMKLAGGVLLAFVVLGPAGPVGSAEEPAPAAATNAAKKPPAQDFSRPMGPPDPYNRGTPRGSMHGFLSAARSLDYERAAQYMDLRQLLADEQDLGPELARKLKVVLDQQLWVDLINLSDSVDGHSDDGLPPWQDRIGEIQTEHGALTLLLQHVPRRPDAVQIWKISSETVAQVPALYAEFEPEWLEAYLPRSFFENAVLGVVLWKWLGLFALFALAALIAPLIAVTTGRLIGFLYTRRVGSLDPRLVGLVRGPVTLAWAVVLFAIGRYSLGLSIELEGPLGVVERLVFVLAAAWFFFRLIDLAALIMRFRAEANENPSGGALLLPAARFVKLLVGTFAFLAGLGTLGINVTAVVAGLGVGGIAVALAAQKTIENLFGGLSLFADRPVQVGDFFRYGTQVGTVEEIGLRSTRIRTLDRTVVTIPNAEFSNLQLENFTPRDRMRLTAVLGVRYETSSDQLRYLLVRLREVLLAHPRVLPEPLRVRFVGFGAYSLDLDILAYVDTSDWNEFLGIREDIYLLFIEVVKEAGTGFAFPSSTTYVGRDDGLDEEEVRRVEERVAVWRQNNELPFPDFDEARRAELEDSLEWPPPGSPRPREFED